MIIYGINEDIMAILWECTGDTLRKAVNNGNLANKNGHYINCFMGTTHISPTL